MPTWIREHMDSAEHAKRTISIGSVVAGSISLLLLLAWSILH